jgi:hypothetical protein
MSFRFIDKYWRDILIDAAKTSRKEILLMAPFIQLPVIKKLIGRRKLKIKVITRFNLNHFYEGVSDLNALEYLLGKGAGIKGIRNLHAKVYIFDSSKAFITSANLTEAGLSKNHEFGLVTDNKELIAKAREYFNGLWNKAGQPLKINELNMWRKEINKTVQSGSISGEKRKLSDYGKKLGLHPKSDPETGNMQDSDQWFVKFFGTSANRADRALAVYDQINDMECHWACTYPRGKRPRKVQNGAVMFIGRLVKEPNDIMIFGRAIGFRHIPGRDDATLSDIKRRHWKKEWPHYIRVRDAEFISGTLKDGVSLNALMDKFGHESFMSTLRNQKRGHGNIDPRCSYRQQAAVELTEKAANWLNSQLEQAFRRYGKISDQELSKLDWPS